MSTPTRPQTSGETILWELDVAGRLAAGATIESVGTATLRNLNTDELYPAGLLDGASFSGTKVRQKVRALQPGHSYRLIVPFTDSSGNVQEAPLVLECAH